jgi:protein-S-isoprenylcysteine O-methyltransferase Ste14
MHTPTEIRTAVLALIFVLLAFFILKKQQSKALNWALFYNFIWLLFTLPLINYYCVGLNLWVFHEYNSIKMPYDICFIWLFLWMLPFYICKGKHALIIGLGLFWIDLLLMPFLETQEILSLKPKWVLGELMVLFGAFLPGYLWGKWSFESTALPYRAALQVIVMALLLLCVIPFTVAVYGWGEFHDATWSVLEFQIICILALPALIAVVDLVDKGKGTAFPYDKTQFLVTTGVYAYIKNPIQWSFTVLFIPLSLFYNSYALAMGVFISIAYTIGVSNTQEYTDMKKRFGSSWLQYFKQVPSWYFQFKPKHIPQGTIYFKAQCTPCEALKTWFEKQNTFNLKIAYASTYKGDALKQVTYVHVSGQDYKSIKALAHAFEHIHLGYASLGWFMRSPIVSHVLQIIIDGLGVWDEAPATTCKK